MITGAVESLGVGRRAFSLIALVWAPQLAPPFFAIAVKLQVHTVVAEIQQVKAPKRVASRTGREYFVLL